MQLFKEIIKRSSRIPTLVSSTVTPDSSKNGCTLTCQLDATLMSVGFKLSEKTFNYFSTLSAEVMEDYAPNVLEAVRELVGDHVSHNVYFIDFPKNVPDTITFWAECIVDALSNPESAEKVSYQLQTDIINLLDLPKYGKYQHSYEDLIKAHEQIIPSMKNCMTILHLGKTLEEESIDLYHLLAGSRIPLNETDLKLLQNLAKIYLTQSQPLSIPMRENKAIINQVRLHFGYKLLVDAPTDILRLSCLLSNGDVTLVEKTKFKSFPRQTRLKLIQELDYIIKKSPDKLGDVNQYCEQWKRLGERLHVHEYKQCLHAQDVFTVARKDKRVHSIAGKIENAFMEGDINKSISLLSNFPGMLFRNLDRIIRSIPTDESYFNEIETLTKTISKVISKVSTHVILSVREHLQNRLIQNNKRVFVNKKGTAWVSDENRLLLNSIDIEKIFPILSKEILDRIPSIENLIVDKKILEVAIPLSNKGKFEGFTIMPRGSTMPVTGEILRFFIYWKQKTQVTDYDLSAIMLDDNFQFIDHLSYTELKTYDGTHSGDLVQAPNGASEFIDINLIKTKCKYIIPSVNVYSGENFIDVDESFFGFMQRTPAQKGMPFEPTTVKTKFDVRGKGKVALPLVFINNGFNNWSAKWVNIYLNGMPSMNRIETNKQTTTLLIKSIVERNYLNMNYVVTLLQQKAKSFSWYEDQKLKDTDTFVGLEAPKILSNKTTVFTLNNLQDLLPA